MKKNEFLRGLMLQAWQLVKRNGYSMKDALKVAWLNAKLRTLMLSKICKFYFKKVDGTLREAYGTLQSNIIPAIAGERKSNATVQVYFDTEKQEYRCFKKANLVKIEY